ncbi:MAG TPA: PilZ domain-containing protein [Candidatus Acidoferrum sp.]|nr:PilZ domain-containing protein [Candidatus Acidoferrum sp.]
MEDERRRVPRFPFVATAEVLEKGAQAGVSARVTELSLYGCYVEMSDPRPKGTQVVLKVFAEGRYLESQGSVLYSQPNQGMGVGFQNVNPHYLMVLKQWLIEAAQAKFGKKD